MKEISSEWLKAAYDDLLVIEEIIEKEYLTHIIAFHAQQCVEKSFKAILEEFERDIPKIHNIEKLLELIRPFMKIDVDMKIVMALDKLYIDARYPTEMGLLPDGKPTLQDAARFYKFATFVYKSVKNFLSGETGPS